MIKYGLFVFWVVIITFIKLLLMAKMLGIVTILQEL